MTKESIVFFLTLQFLYLSDIYNNDDAYIYKLMSTDRDRSGEPVMCSRCNSTFESESDFMKHYDRQHSP